jgi:hypothetical protein
MMLPAQTKMNKKLNKIIWDSSFAANAQTVSNLSPSCFDTGV